MIYGPASMIRFNASFLSRVALTSLLAATAAPAAAQQSCQDDFQRLSQKRMAQIEVLNRLGKAGKGKMDPTAACPASRNLLGVETEMLNYMTKNKDWCNIPDNVLEGFKAARAKTQNFSSQACTFAAKVKQMQQQQREQAANGGAAPQKLPAGPL